MGEYMVTRVATAPAYQAERRRIRSPKHTFNVKHQPYAIQPFMIAPVLPGETMKNLLMQARVVSDPITSPLVGWWLEYMFFYVKHRDLDARDQLTEMMLDPEWSSTPLHESASTQYYHYGNTINWTKLCLKRVVEEYFRNEGEAWDDFTLNGLPIASVNQETYLNSFVAADVLDADDVMVPVVADEVAASEIDKALKQWQLLRMNNLTEMSYEDYLRTFGIRSNDVELHRPELLRLIREWTYPTNHVNPQNGEPTSAVSWSIQERADKDRFFKEPGFILGVTLARPKVYYKAPSGAAVGMMTDALSWLPALLHDDVSVSMKAFAEGDGPVANFDTVSNAGYWVDVRDLLIYGDQFVNFDRSTATDANLVSLPTTSGNHRYVGSADVAALFKSAGVDKIRQDGIVSLSIAGRQRDTTPATPVSI